MRRLASDSRPAYVTRLLPEDVRYISDNGNDIIVERPPCKVAIKYRKGTPAGGLARAPLEYFEVTLPWQVYYLNISRAEAYVYFRNAPLVSNDDKLYPATLPNATQHGSVCLGNSLRRDIKKMAENRDNIGVIINKFI